MKSQPSITRRLSRIAGAIAISLGVYWAIDAVLEARRVETTKSRLEQIGVALRNYHNDYRSFPPAVVLGPDGVPWHSWRVLLLPYLGQEELAQKYRMDEPWDGPHNQKLIASCPELFQLPTSEVRTGFANASIVIGRRTAWPAQHPLRAGDFMRGASNTLHIVETPPAREWTNPREFNVREFERLFDETGAESRRGVVFSDGTVRRLSGGIDRKLLRNFLAPNGPKLTFRGNDWPAMFSESRSASAGVAVDSAELPHTAFHASWERPLNSDRNGLWCAVFQIGWDVFKAQSGGLAPALKPSEIVDRLNSTPFDRDNLDPGSYRILSGAADSQTTQRLREQIGQDFPDANPQLSEINGPLAVRIYGGLQKSIQFPSELSPMKPMVFRSATGGFSAESFGNENENDGGESLTLEDTVYVGDYISDDDCIIVLRTEGGRDDEIVLALVRPEATLKQCWQTVKSRLERPHRNRVASSLRSGESINIPIIDLNVEHEFVELRHLLMKEDVRGLPSRIEKASESIRFRLDERGADLLAQLDMVRVLGEFGGGGAAFDPNRRRHFIFNRPFLLALREKSADQPYLLCWVAMPDIMLPASS